MRVIHKRVEPNELIQYRAQPGTVYDGGGFTPVKQRIRECLLAEQGHLCAYCMQRINEDKMRVEHWHSQSRYPNQQLQYQNLLGCCMGNEGKRRNVEHCDKRKGDDDLLYNPSEPLHYDRMRIKYTGKGIIRSDDQAFDDELNNILNLNWYRLKRNRESVWKSVTQVLSRSLGSRTRPEIQKQIAKWITRDSDGKLREYCDVAIYYLKKKL